MPIYADIARDLLDGIDTGKYPVGGLVPGELELAEHYKVSRQTVRSAMQRLTEIGAITRRPGAGTRVEARTPSLQGFQQTLGSISDLVELAAATRRHICETATVVMDKVMAKQFECAPGSRWRCLSYLRLPQALGAPIAFVACFVEESYASVYEKLTPESGLISDLIQAQYGVVAEEVRQSVRATLLDSGMAKRLDAKAGSAALEVVRRYADRSGRVFEVSVSTSPAERYAVTSVLKRIRTRTE